MNVKELFENEELMDSIVEDIEDIPEDAEVTYEVWALGYTTEDDCTDDEVLVGEFTDPDEAVKCAESVTIEKIRELGYGEADPDTAYFSIEVETVVDNPDEDEEGTMNIGTVYQRDLWIEEPGDLEDEDSRVALKTEDYELLEDGTLKVSCKILKDFNKNDYVTAYFVDEPQTCPLLYKIMSKVIYADGDYYHCELAI